MDPKYVVLLIIVGIGVLLIRQLLRKSVADYPYRRKSKLFSDAERSFYGVLNQAVGERLLIFGKVRVADILSPKKGLARAKWQSAFNRINSKHFDFILCEPNTLDVRCGIELNDKSHSSKSRIARDEFLRNACAAANFPLFEIVAKRGYSVQEIRRLVLDEADA